MDNDRDTVEFWSSLFQSFADSEPKDNPYPVVRSPIMTMSTPMAIDEPVEPWKVLEYGGKDVRPMAIDVPAEPWKVGGKEAQPANAAAEAGYKNVNTDQEKSTQKATEKVIM
ncbi:hypothetical protein AT1G68250 [Arabidopsis thaliana]|uniref:Uncharacterized protein n=1 Tax=Arabidopsis thaliana TaxID=3702 RepID=B3H767_ARATH|nr:uncharacterized protein AT1G68250 [Arabidopsis thaliana]AEE34773.1 hypothetical protein AT1G68250 [Arabidopsis thaliana]|eukprot:NP_001117570.1 hypothetical protein AT1G68250 [Arabidopsis thaliana]